MCHEWHIRHMNGISRWYATNDYSFKADGAFQQQLMKDNSISTNSITYHHVSFDNLFSSILRFVSGEIS